MDKAPQQRCKRIIAAVRLGPLLAVLLLTLAGGGLPGRTWAETRPLIRVTAGDHPYFGRVVLNAPGLTYAVNRDGDHVTILFSNDPILGELPPTPRNVLAIRAVPGGLELTVPLGANVRTARYGDKVVVDIDDTVANRPAPGPPAEAQAAPHLTDNAKPGAPERNPSVEQPTTSGPPGAAQSPGPAANAGGDEAARNAAPANHVLAKAAAGEAAPGNKIPPPANQPPGSLSPDQGNAAPNRTAEAFLPQIVIPGRRRGEFAQLSPSGLRPDEGTPTPAGTHADAAGLATANQPDHGSSVSFASDVGAKSPPDSGSGSAVAAATQVPAQPPAAAAEPGRPGPPSGAPAAPSAESSASQSKDVVQVWPVTQDSVPMGPTALRAVRSRPPDNLPGTAIGLPFRGTVGAALFSRGPESFVVFDERQPIDLSALGDDPVFGSAVVTLHPAATVIRLTRPAGQSAMLYPDPLGWRLSLVSATPKPTAIAQAEKDRAITFTGGTPGQVVAITDPGTGGTLLVGTQRTAGRAVLVERHTAEFNLPVTGQGIVVEPLSDAISLQVTPAGFVLSAAPSGLALSAAQPMPEATLAAARLTRRFEFPRQTTEVLAQRAQRQKVAAARAPLLRRGPLRFALAESLLGLGCGVEAQTLLRVTMKDDPQKADSPAAIGLAGVAAVLAHRPAEAGGLDDPRLTGSDEVALWRALRTAMLDKTSPAAAAVLATTAPLLFTYPAEMRDRVLPLALETMIRGGQASAAAPLLAQRQDDPRLAYARAMLKQAQGDNAGALAAFDALVNSRSDYDHARAATRATELRLTMGKLDDEGAADALEAQLDAWRGDGRDLALQLRIAELRQKAGQWRAALAGLRAAKTQFPDHATEIDRRLKDAFAAVARDPELPKMPPAELVALLDENAELLPDGPDGEPMRQLLAQKLMALDLPKQADAVLTRLMRAAPFGPARAGFGATLATVRLREGDADGALTALSESSSADMDDAVRQRRQMIAAQIDAKRGHTDEAVASLSGDKTEEAEDARATILEHAQDWPAARDALALLAVHVVPDHGMLNDAQLKVVLRLATAAARADDDATLASLRAKLNGRIGSGPQADMFRLLTAPPVSGDLGRAREEVGVARAVAADMKASPAHP